MTVLKILAFLGGAALVVFTVASVVRTFVLPRASADPLARTVYRAGLMALRRIADFFGIQYDPDPDPEDPISRSREDFDSACIRFIDAGVPLKRDLDQAWRDFSGWRVDYDTPLLSLCALTMAPLAAWSSDRPGANWRQIGSSRPWGRLRRLRSRS